MVFIWFQWYLTAYYVLFFRITGIFQQKKMSTSLKKLRRTRVNGELFLRITRRRLIRAINIFH